MQRYSWLKSEGYERVGILGTSVGSCIAFLAFAHEPDLNAGAFNHVSGYVADVVWHGLSTAHVRAGFADQLTLDELRNYWAPISPLPFMPRVAQMGHRPIRFIIARYDLTFPLDLSHEAIAEARRHKLPLDVVWLPCGHYTTGELPWKAIDAWKIATFFQKTIQRINREVLIGCCVICDCNSLFRQRKYRLDVDRHVLQLIERLLHRRPDHRKLIQYRFRLIVRSFSLEREQDRASALSLRL